MESYQKIKKTITEMMDDRGYTIAREYPYSGDTDAELFSPMIVGEHSDATVGKIYTFMAFKKIGKKEIIRFIEIVKSSEYSHVILITHDPLTPQAKKLLKSNTPEIIECFLYKEVIFNVTKHILQPKFTLLTASESKTLCESMQKTLMELPKMGITDPIARYYHATSKNVFKIERTNNIYYRVVI